MKKVILVLSILFSLTVNAQTLTPCTGTTCAPFSNSDLRQIFGILGQWLPATYTSISTGSNVNVVSLPSNTTNLATYGNQVVEQSTLTNISNSLTIISNTLNSIYSKLDSINNKSKLVIVTYSYNTTAAATLYAASSCLSASITPTITVPNGDYELMGVVLTPSVANSSVASGLGWSLYNSIITPQVDGGTYLPSQDDSRSLLSFNNVITGSPFVAGGRVGTWSAGATIISPNFRVTNNFLYIQLYWISATTPTVNQRVVVKLVLKRLN